MFEGGFIVDDDTGDLAVIDCILFTDEDDIAVVDVIAGHAVAFAAETEIGFDGAIGFQPDIMLFIGVDRLAASDFAEEGETLFLNGHDAGIGRDFIFPSHEISGCGIESFCEQNDLIVWDICDNVVFVFIYSLF